jgi:Signal transduction histidine kinase
MNKPWLYAWRRSITFKIFLITLALLIVSAALIYAVLYLYLPAQYEKNKINLLEEKIAQFTRSVEGIPLAEAARLIDELARQTNSVVLLTERDAPVYISSMLSAAGSGTLQGTLKPLDPESGGRVERGFVSTGPPAAKVESAGQPANPFDRRIAVTVDGRPMTLVVNTVLQPVDEAARVMALFIPNIALITLAVSLAGAYLFSRIVARPLIRLNQAARKMAGLKFPAAIRYSSPDEIGQLAGSLNEMSANLRQALDDLHQTNERLKIEMAKEREIEDQRRRLFAMISHELKSPLTAVKGQLEGMIHGLGAYRDRDKYLKRSKAILDGMEQLIHDILQISKLEQHTFEPSLESVNLSEIMKDAIGRAAFFAEQKRIHLESDIMPHARITADPQLLEKAVYNIIHNGIAHSDPGERVVIGLTEDRGSHAVILTVINTGARIPDRQLHKVFDPFYRPEESRSRNSGGSGLGLYLVKSVFDALSVEYALRNVPEGVQFRAVFRTDRAAGNSPELHTGSI